MLPARGTGRHDVGVARTEPVVQVVDADPTWPARFAEARDQLRECLGPAALEIHHIGSTSVPGLAAKPTIDVLVVVADTTDVLDQLDRLSEAGFEHRPDAWPDPSRHLFLRRVVHGRRTHHVHVVPTDSHEIDDYLTLRDYLRCHPDEAAAYQQHKLELVAETGGERDAYVDRKEHYVEPLLVRARAWDAERTRTGSHAEGAT